MFGLNTKEGFFLKDKENEIMKIGDSFLDVFYL